MSILFLIIIMMVIIAGLWSILKFALGVTFTLLGFFFKLFMPVVLVAILIGVFLL